MDEGRLSRDPEARERGRDLVKEFVGQVLEGEIAVSKDAEAMINARIAQIDHLISLQLNEVLHHPDFQQLESSWRGLRYLLDQSSTSDMLKIKVLNANKKEVLRDLQRAPEFDQSALFKKIYEEEFGVFGGAPFAALIGDYEFGKGPQDMELLEKFSEVAAAAHAPFLQPHHLISSTWMTLPTWMLPGILARSSIPPNTPSGSHSARVKTRATWA